MPDNHRFWGFSLLGKQLILQVTIRIDPTLIVVLEGHQPFTYPQAQLAPMPSMVRLKLLPAGS